MYDNMIAQVLAAVPTPIQASPPITLHVYRPDMSHEGDVEDYISLIWEEHYRGKGALTLICVDSEDNIALLQQGWYLYRVERKTAMVITSVKYNTSDHEIIVNGYTTSYLLSQRVVYPVLSIHNVEAGMYQLASNNKRGLPYLINAPSKGLPAVFDTQFTFTGVLDAIINLAKQADYGFFMMFDHKTKQHIFTVYQGADKTYGNGVNPPVLFSEEFGNLNSMVIVDDVSEFKTMAYVAGEGEGAARTIVTVNDNITGLNRFELAVDARDLQKEHRSDAEYAQLLSARGIEKLNEYNRVQTFIAEVEPAQFNVDFFLGDKITCDSKKYKVRINTRILQFAEVRENNQTKLHLTLGEPEINPFKR